ncbi:MAG: PepSY domain-containing protein [Pseudomonadota bacterium]|nr:PepSY domain-containing protein [Pseudomonadota bacterium]
MKRMITAAVLATAAISASAASASGDRCNVPAAEWQPREALQKKLEGEGWTIARIKTDDGCYEVYARDARGHRVEALVDPKSFEIVRMKSED